MNWRVVLFGVFTLAILGAANFIIANQEIDVSSITTSKANAINTATDELGMPDVDIEQSVAEALLLQPLFSSTRKPFQKPKKKLQKVVAKKKIVKKKVVAKVAKPAVKPKPNPPEKPILTLHGILINAQKSMALISSAKSPNPEWFNSDEEIENWKISVVDKNLVKVSLDQQSFDLLLYVDNGDKEN